MKTFLLTFLFILQTLFLVYSQCPNNSYTAPCSGGNGPLFDNVNCNPGDLYWWNGGNVIFNSINVNGGTVVICSGTVNVSTINFNGGTILVGPNAVLNYNNSLNINNGCVLINYGKINVAFFLFIQGNPGYVFNYGSGTISVGMATFLNNTSVFINQGTFISNDLVIQTNSSPALCQLAGAQTIVQNNFTNSTLNSVTSSGGPSCIYLMNNITMNQDLTNTSLVYVCDAPGGGYSGAGTFGSATYFSNCTGCSGPLPVTLITFEVLMKIYPTLSWMVHQENSIKSYFVERSYDGITWEKLTEIQANQNSALYTSSYQLSDLEFDFNQTKVYYRLTSIDYNDNKKIIGLKGLNIISNGFETFLNQKKLYLITHDPEVQIDNIEIFDISGRKIKSVLNSFTVSIEDLSSGFYIVKILTSNKQSITLKIFNN